MVHRCDQVCLHISLKKPDLKPPSPSHDTNDLNDFDLFSKFTPRKKLFR